jgi:hypothetical protein
MSAAEAVSETARRSNGRKRMGILKVSDIYRRWALHNSRLPGYVREQKIEIGDDMGIEPSPPPCRAVCSLYTTVAKMAAITNFKSVHDFLNQLGWRLLLLQAWRSR